MNTAAAPKATLVATAPDGSEVRYRTAAGYMWAGIAQQADGTWALLAKGWAWKSVKDRTGLIWRRTGGLRAYRSGWHVVPFKPNRQGVPMTAKNWPAKQYGIRWPTGSVFCFSSLQDAEDALAEDGRGVGVLVVHEIEPGTPNCTEWREVED